ncbi:unnamed protein product, partial [Ectocarpus sp. 12 AP-2014]
TNRGRSRLISFSASETAANMNSSAGVGDPSRWRRVPALPGISVLATAGIVLACLSATTTISSRPSATVMAAESDISGAALGEEDNAALVEAAHELRRKLVPPHQSLFRVVCVLVYEDFSGRLHRITGE